jgi:hypothetical protein
MAVRDKIFVSYSHKDKKLFEEFRTMLAPAIQNGTVDLWDDTRIAPGAKWEDQIEAALASASVAVLLVSPNFLASHFIVKQELPPLLKAAEEDGVTIFWLYLSACLYEQTEIGSYQAAHDISQPLDRLSKSQRQGVLSEACGRLILPAQSNQLLRKTDEGSGNRHLKNTKTDLRWECSLLITEALDEAFTAAQGAGPTTTLHRRLELARKLAGKGEQLLTECDSSLSSPLRDSLVKAIRATRWLVDETRIILPEAGDDERNGTNDHFEKAKEDAYYSREQLMAQLSNDPDFRALRNSDSRWPLLGFRDGEDYETYLFPTLERLFRSTDPMQYDLFERLLEKSEFTPGQLIQEGYRKELVMDSLNALLRKKWAEWTDLSSLGSEGSKGKVTEVGKRLLKQTLAARNSSVTH